MASTENQPAANEGAVNLVITSPLDFQVFQRRTLQQGAVRVRGQAGGECDAVEARLTGKPLAGSWHKIDYDLTTREITGNLAVAAGGW